MDDDGKTDEQDGMSHTQSSACQEHENFDNLNLKIEAELNNGVPLGCKVREEEKDIVEEVERMTASIDDTGADEGGLELNDVKEKMDDSKVEDDMGFGAVVCEKIGADDYGNVNEGFKLELENLVVESIIIDSEKRNFAGDIDSTQNSIMEVVLRALSAEAEHANMVIPEVEGNPMEILKIEASGASQHWNDVAEPKSVEAEFGVWEDMEEVASDAIDPKNYFVGEKNVGPYLIKVK
ncbi:hypothetical protein IEQ34_006755 [Dendrobium chrysotoxum]|uniref:Uncharacterized protein n=1 Tax=Dendrobium chrysotoxum TaxID=161865 RepID=A0AAV7H8I8_DENCH|nr:hypothetical protein IEQ34_006755 [Dendrobium chrysotoxum]